MTATAAPDLSLKACRQATHDWCARRIRVGRERGTIPTFGSVEWHKLPDGDAVKAAALVVAAYCWWESVVNLERDLAEELEGRRVAEDRIDAEEWDGAIARVRRISTAPSFAERQRRSSG